MRVLRAPMLTSEEAELLEGATLFDPSDLDAAIVGVTRARDGHVAVYDYDRIVTVYANLFRRDNLDDDDDEDFHLMAVEWVDFNTLGVIPNIRDRRPIVVSSAREVTSGKRFTFHKIGYRQVA